MKIGANAGGSFPFALYPNRRSSEGESELGGAGKCVRMRKREMLGCNLIIILVYNQVSVNTVE